MRYIKDIIIRVDGRYEFVGAFVCVRDSSHVWFGGS